MPHIDIERRSCVRFEIPGATLSFKIKKAFHLKIQYGEEFCPVANMSRGGIRFLSKSLLKINTPITLKISVPGEHVPLQIKGIVRWVGKFAGANYACQVGVQFNPYGDETKDQNYPGALVKIIALEQKFAPPQDNTPR